MTTTDYQQRFGLSWTPSHYQTAIWDWVQEGRGSAVVEAVAGSGKSTTIVHAANLVHDGLFLAFNKSIATELGARLGEGMEASTIHSHGIRACFKGLGKLRVDTGKYRKMVREVEKTVRRGLLFGATVPQAAARTIDAKPRSWPSREILRLLDLARIDLLDQGLPAGDFATEIDQIARRHDLQWLPAFDGVVPLVVQPLMQRGLQDTRTIDFTDMVWLTDVLGLQPRRYSWIFVDECQDLSRASLALIQASVRPGGRCLFVGDRRQAIYAFAGADSESFTRTLDYCNGKSMPLSVCYRCPTAALDLAREYCPQIEARPGAVEGLVRKEDISDVPEMVSEGDMVLCRLNAPLVRLCFRLIKEGVPAQVRGRSIGDGLAKIARESAGLIAFDQFGKGLDLWASAQQDYLTKKIDDEDALGDALERVSDQVECTRIIWAKSGAKTLEALEHAITDLFSDDRASVQLSSVHKAKGLEADRVWILCPDLLPSPRARTPEQIEQEQNLAYVALTRCRQELIWIDGE